MGIWASKDVWQVAFSYELNFPRHYSLGVDGLMEYLDDARGLYTVEYLVDIAAGIRPNDKVSLQFGTDTPIKIGYEVDGCEIKHILAPRIDDDGGDQDE